MIGGIQAKLIEDLLRIIEFANQVNQKLHFEFTWFVLFIYLQHDT